MHKNSPGGVGFIDSASSFQFPDQEWWSGPWAPGPSDWGLGFWVLDGLGMPE